MSREQALVRLPRCEIAGVELPRARCWLKPAQQRDASEIAAITRRQSLLSVTSGARVVMAASLGDSRSTEGEDEESTGPNSAFFPFHGVALSSP